MKKFKETDLQKQIVEYLNLMGHFVWRNNSGAVFSEYKGKKRMIKFGFKGCADVVGILRDGRFIAVECKIGYNKPTEAQYNFLDEVTHRGGIGMWTTNLDNVINRLKEK